MNKKTIILLVIFASMAIPVIAAGTEYTTTTLYFNVAQSEEITVYLIGHTTTGNTTSPTGTATLYNIEFNSSQSSAQWINASVAGDGGANIQTFTNGILLIDNTGTANSVQLNISSNVSDWTSGGGQGNPAGCLNLKIFKNQSVSADGDAECGSCNPATYQQLNTTNVTLDSTFNTNELQWEVWLWGNFSGCNYGTYTEQMYVWAKFP